jgi:recombination protein RecR
MSYYAEPIARLLEELERLPGIGPKSAQRLAFHILKGDDEAARRLSDSIVEVRRLIHFCPRCFNFASGDLCEYCADPQRDTASMCVVEEPRDVVAIERTGLEDGSVTEVVVATNPNVEGETTALYLARLIKPLGIRVTRIASGLPVGGDLEYADEVTLGRALEARRDM